MAVVYEGVALAVVMDLGLVVVVLRAGGVGLVYFSGGLDAVWKAGVLILKLVGMSLVILWQVIFFLLLCSIFRILVALWIQRPIRWALVLLSHSTL